MFMYHFQLWSNKNIFKITSIHYYSTDQSVEDFDTQPLISA